MIVAVVLFSESMNPVFSSFLLLFQMYLCLELAPALIATFPRFHLGMELAPQFNEPYLSTSLQEFWGRRWNMTASSVLRPTVYLPTLDFSAPFIGLKWASIPAVMSTFLVSTVMHELIFFYMSRTGRPHLAHSGGISSPLTVTFVLSTGFWLLFPELLRLKADVRAI